MRKEIEVENVDSHKVVYHPERVVELLTKGDCYPIYVEIGPTNACNHRCIFCALDFLERKSDFIDKEVMFSALKEMAKKGVKSIMFAGEGEPLLHPNIYTFVRYAKEHGIDVSITTNGVLFDKEKAENCLPHLSWIRFSVDAGTPETYRKIHKSGENDFEKVMENIKNAVEMKKEKKLKVTIGVQFLLIPNNIKDVLELAKECKKIGVDNLQIKPYSQHPSSLNRFIINYEDYAYLESELEKLNSSKFKILFRKQTMKRVKEGATYNECYGIPFFALIDAKGNIIPCNLYYEQQDFAYGNLYKQSFSEIWQSEKRKEVLEKLRKKGVNECRHACRLDVINRYLHRLKTPLPHDNFI